MLRLAFVLAFAAIGAGPVWAQTAEAVQAAAKAVDAIQGQGVPGPIAVLAGLGFIAIIVVLGLVIQALWKTIQGRDSIITALLNKRGDEADARAERYAKIAEGANSTAAGMVRATEGFEATLGDLKDIIKVQAAATDALLKGQDASAARLEKNADGIAKLLGGRA